MQSFITPNSIEFGNQLSFNGAARFLVGVGLARFVTKWSLMGLMGLVFDGV